MSFRFWVSFCYCDCWDSHLVVSQSAQAELCASFCCPTCFTLNHTIAGYPLCLSSEHRQPFFSVFRHHITWIAIPLDSVLLKANTISCELGVVLFVRWCSCCDNSTLFLGNNFHVVHLRPRSCGNEQLPNLSGFNTDLFLIHITCPFLLVLFILGPGGRTSPFWSPVECDRRKKEVGNIMMALKNSAQKVTDFTSPDSSVAKQVTWPRLTSSQCGITILPKKGHHRLRGQPWCQWGGMYDPPTKSLYLE